MESKLCGNDRRLLSAVLARASAGAFVADPAGRCEMVNERWCELTGLDAGALLGDGWMAAVPLDDRTEVVGAWWSAVQGDVRFDRSIHVRRADGTEQLVRVEAERIVDDVGTTIGWVGSVDLMPDPESLQDATTGPIVIGRFEQAFECSPIGMALTTLEGQYVRVNPAMCGLLGRSATNLLATSVLETTHPDDLGRTVAAAVDLLEGTVPSFSLEKRFLSEVGQPVWTRATTTLLRDDANQPVHFLTQVEDIEERRELIEQLRQAALHDPLTGLANRAGLEEYVAALPPGAVIGVLALDLDRFKEVNDVAGHEAGDEVLRTVTRRILSVVRPHDHAARTGGDEFVVLCCDPRPEFVVTTLAGRLVTAIGAPIRIGEVSLSVSASAGVAVGPVEEVSALRVGADQASYRSKRRGGAIVSVCHED